MIRCALTLALAALLLAPAGLRAASQPHTQEGTDIRELEVAPAPDRPARLTPGDEIDQLEKQLNPKPRFKGYQPHWRVQTRTFTWKHYQRTETKDYFKVVLDGDKVVALVRSGDIMLIARTPETASTRINMPTERLHLDNLLGPSLPTYQFIQNVKTHGSIYQQLGDKVLPREHFEKSDTHLAFIRQQSLPEYDVTARFIFTVDPVYGYRVDAVRDVYFKNKPEPGKVKMNGGSFTPGCYVPWEHAAIYDRTAWTPISGEIEGWANNLVTMDRCDANKKQFAWRDGGFITYMTDKHGWSPCFTRKDGTGDTPPLAVCNAHNDFHIKFLIKELPQTDDGRWHFHAVHRLLSLPPELTAHVWDNVKLIQRNNSAIIIKLGQVEDFENQPVPLTEPARGLVWTSGAPDLVEGIARSGKHSLLIQGRAWPNLPQVSLKPGTRYILEGWFKVEPWTKEQLEAAKAKDQARRDKLTRQGKELPPAIDWDNLDAKAFISGDFYEWSPYSGKMLELNRTNEATTGKDGWQHVKWEFTSPDWGPFINIAFHAQYCNAYLDDFALREVTEELAKTKND